ncbi:MAG: cytochrome C [Proteobacteria bacterium]|nr:cytochrome C [Pseudomonadota bacterium]
MHAAAWLLAATALLAAPVWAADTAARDLAATCAACHSAPAGTPDAPPLLAGMPAPAMQAALTAFARRERPATVMHHIAAGLTSAQIALLAQWFESAPKPAAARQAPQGGQENSGAVLRFLESQPR